MIIGEISQTALIEQSLRQGLAGCLHVAPRQRPLPMEPRAMPSSTDGGTCQASFHRACGHHPLAALARDGGDEIEGGVVVEDGNVELLRCRGDEKAALGEQPLTLKRAAYVCGGCIDRCKPVKGSHKLVPVLGVAGRVTNFKVADAGRARSPFAASGLTTSRTCSRPSRFTTLVSRRNVSATLRHDPEGAHRPAGPALRLGVPDGMWPGAAPRSWRAMFGRARQVGHAARRSSPLSFCIRFASLMRRRLLFHTRRRQQPDRRRSYCIEPRNEF